MYLYIFTLFALIYGNFVTLELRNQTQFIMKVNTTKKYLCTTIANTFI